MDKSKKLPLGPPFFGLFRVLLVSQEQANFPPLLPQIVFFKTLFSAMHSSGRCVL